MSRSGRAVTPVGSGLILLISGSWRSPGCDGLRRWPLLNANYIAGRLEEDYRDLYRGLGGFVTHEAIRDLCDLKSKANVDVENIA